MKLLWNMGRYWERQLGGKEGEEDEEEEEENKSYKFCPTWQNCRALHFIHAVGERSAARTSRMSLP